MISAIEHKHQFKHSVYPDKPISILNKSANLLISYYEPIVEVGIGTFTTKNNFNTIIIVMSNSNIFG